MTFEYSPPERDDVPGRHGTAGDPHGYDARVAYQAARAESLTGYWRGGARLRVFLGTSVAAAAALPPFDPDGEPGPQLRPRAASRGTYMKFATVDARLSPYAPDAKAGVSDKVLARRTELSVGQVRAWRRRQGIRHEPGRPTGEVGRWYLSRSLVGATPGPVPHAVSPVGGDWRLPEYVLREPLDFNLFARAVSLLVEQFTTEEISKAIGIAERDIYNVVVLYAARGAR